MVVCGLVPRCASEQLLNYFEVDSTQAKKLQRHFFVSHKVDGFRVTLAATGLFNGVEYSTPGYLESRGATRTVHSLSPHQSSSLLSILSCVTTSIQSTDVALDAECIRIGNDLHFLVFDVLIGDSVGQRLAFVDRLEILKKAFASRRSHICIGAATRTELIHLKHWEQFSAPIPKSVSGSKLFPELGRECVINNTNIPVDGLIVVAADAPLKYTQTPGSAWPRSFKSSPRNARRKSYDGQQGRHTAKRARMSFGDNRLVSNTHSKWHSLTCLKFKDVHTVDLLVTREKSVCATYYPRVGTGQPVLVNLDKEVQFDKTKIPEIPANVASEPGTCVGEFASTDGYNLDFVKWRKEKSKGNAEFTVRATLAWIKCRPRMSSRFIIKTVYSNK